MTDEQKEKITALRREGSGYTAIANSLGISKDTVKSFCRRNGLTGTMARKITSDKCRECGKRLPRPSGTKPRIFCSEECRVKWWHEHPDKINQRAVYSFVCAFCGKNFTAYGNRHRKYCSHECYINARFRGGGGHD